MCYNFIWAFHFLYWIWKQEGVRLGPTSLSIIIWVQGQHYLETILGPGSNWVWLKNQTESYVKPQVTKILFKPEHSQPYQILNYSGHSREFLTQTSLYIYLREKGVSVKYSSQRIEGTLFFLLNNIQWPGWDWLRHPIYSTACKQDPGKTSKSQQMRMLTKALPDFYLWCLVKREM